MKFEINNDILTIFLLGRIDSTNASKIEEEIVNIKDNNVHTNLILDFDSLEYISSAGLRIILRLIKEYKELILNNVNADVYDVLEMTGFTEMATVNKAYRKLSVDGCEVIGEGANGKVYRIDTDTIVKVYSNKDALPDIKRERELARLAFIKGVPTAIPYDVVKVGDTYGSVFELLNARSFAQLINSDDSSKGKYINMSVDLLKIIHSNTVDKDSMPDMREVAIKWAKFLKDYIDEVHYNKLLSLVEGVEYDTHLMHGDYHMKNIMLQNEEALLIDMDTLCYGSPIFEFASIFNAYKGYTYFDTDEFNSFIGMKKSVCDYIWDKTLELYFNNLDSKSIEIIKDKASLMGFVRIIRRSIRRGYLEDNNKCELVNKYIALLYELIERIDDLKI